MPDDADDAPGFRAALDGVDLVVLLALVGAYLALLAPRLGDLGIAGARIAGGVYLAYFVWRRRFTRMPVRGPLRRGPWWSLAGVTAILLLFAGLGGMMTAATWLEQSRQPPPDVTAAANREADDAPSFDDDVGKALGIPGDPDALAQRHALYVQKYIDEHEAEWREVQGDRRRDSVAALVVGLVFFAIGVLVDRRRYGPKSVRSAAATSR